MNNRSLLEKITYVVWVIFLLTLPVTSFPYFPPAVGGAALVRPLLVYPLLILLLIMTIPRLWKHPLPRPFIPLLSFAIVATISTLLSTFSNIEELRGVSLWERGTRNLLTLALGGAIYFTVSLMPRNTSELRAALRWLYAGMSIALAWGTLQVVYVLAYNQTYFQFLNNLQKFVSTRRLFTRRVSGLTFEPNWFAEQISFLLLPWLLASVLSGESLFRWRWRRITIESLLLIWSVGVLIFTFSRAGLFVLIMLILVSVLIIRPRLPNWFKSKQGWRSLLQRGFIVLLIFIILGGVLLAAGTQNNYFSRIWRFWSDPQSGDDFLTYISFSQRLVYWESAYSMFAENPVLGIGLGNFAFYFEEMLPDRPLYQTPELLRQITPGEGRNKLVTPKNLHVKVLGETGLVGTAVFIAFLIGLAGSALLLLGQHKSDVRYWGQAGLLGLTAFILASLSYDSFALPNMWVVFGLISAAANLYSPVNYQGALQSNQSVLSEV